MSGGSPAAILFDVNGIPVGVSASQALPTSGNLGLMLAAVDPSGFVRYLSTISGSLQVTGSLAAVVTFPSELNIANFPAVQAVSGTVGAVVENWPASLGVSASTALPVFNEGTVGVSGTVSAVIENWPATIGVSASAALQVWSEGNVGVSGTVSVVNFPVVQAVSGSQLTGSTFSGFPIIVGGAWNSGSQAGNAQYVKAIAVDASGSVYVTTSGTLPVAVQGTVTISESSQVSVNNFPAVQNVSGTVGAVIENWPSVIGVSASVALQTWVAGTQGVSGTVDVTVTGSTGLHVGNSPTTPLWVTTTGSLPVTLASQFAASGTLVVNSGSTSSTTLLSANASRKGLLIYNDDNSPSNAFILFGSGVDAPTKYTFRLSPGSMYENGYTVYQGIVTVDWDGASGSLYVTELQ